MKETLWTTLRFLANGPLNEDKVVSQLVEHSTALVDVRVQLRSRSGRNFRELVNFPSSLLKHAPRITANLLSFNVFFSFLFTLLCSPNIWILYIRHFSNESATAIATLCDWLKKSRATFSSNEKQNHKTFYARFFPLFEQVMIGRSIRALKDVRAKIFLRWDFLHFSPRVSW